MGVTTDYIYGISVVLCDGSLYQIFENDNINTKCLQGCDESSEFDDEELQELLYAIKGGGGGNFGILSPFAMLVCLCFAIALCNILLPLSIQSVSLSQTMLSLNAADKH